MAEAGRKWHGSPAAPRGEAEPLKLRTPFRQIKPRSSLSARGTAQKDSFICFKRASLAITDALFSRNEKILQLLAGGNEKPPWTPLSHWLATGKQLTIYLCIYLFQGPWSNCKSCKSLWGSGGSGGRQATV